jgi:prophage DNA circulation protein
VEELAFREDLVHLGEILQILVSIVRSGIEATTANRHSWRLLDIEVLERMADIRRLVEPTPEIVTATQMVIWNALELTHAAVLEEGGRNTAQGAVMTARINAMSALADLTVAIENARPSRLARNLQIARA